MTRSTEDIYFIACYKEVKDYIDANGERVFYGRQLEIHFEGDYFHWITSRASKELADNKAINIEKRSMNWGGSINLYWSKAFRYYKKAARELVSLVEQFSANEITTGVGDIGEHLILEGFVRSGFQLAGRDINSINGINWIQSYQNLDFIFLKDEIY